MKTILVKDLFSSAFSESKAILLREEIQKVLNENETVVLDFTDITKFTTLFFNFSTGFFISLLGPNLYNEKIQLKGLTTLGESTYKSSYENSIKKYDPSNYEEILNIIKNPEN